MKVNSIIDFEKKLAVSKENQMLLNRLMAIKKKRDDLSPKKLKPIIMPSQMSMNYTHKKKEAERIDRENALMMDRLVR